MSNDDLLKQHAESYARGHLDYVRTPDENTVAVDVGRGERPCVIPVQSSTSSAKIHNELAHALALLLVDFHRSQSQLDALSVTPSPPNSVPALIDAVCGELATMLKEKNAAYGNSALDPVRVFSKADPVEQIKVRLDDKLSRLARGHAGGEDVRKDLLGYLVLWEVCERLAASKGADRG